MAAFVFRQMLDLIQDSLVSLFYPQTCHECSGIVEVRSDGVVCGACWRITKIFSGLETLCLKCGAFLSDAEPVFDTHCHKCDGDAYDRARSLGPYRNGLAASILHMKREPHLPERLRHQLLQLFFDEFASQTTLVVPVPLSAVRLFERGFNQAELLGEAIGRSAEIPFDKQSLARYIHTPMHRAAMDRKAREKTVREAFQVMRPKLVDGQDILLVDDILTSGATASYCAQALKASGAAKVNVLTLARAV